MASTSRERVALYRAKRRAEGAPDTTRRNRKAEKREYKQRKSVRERAFVACDGEGCGLDALGRQLFMLFRMGERELFTGAPLRTEELLDFICSHSGDDILVGFAFGYDVTMILRDLPVVQQKRLFEPKSFEPGHSRFVWYKDYDIDYLPKQYLKIRRVRITRGDDGCEKRVGIKGSQRTIYETFGFFQKSFLKVIEEFKVGTPAQREMIAQNKAKRSEFISIDQEVRDYCALECDFLAQLMEQLRGYCYAAGIRPRSWSGAGKLASALHDLHHTPKAKALLGTVPDGVLSFANMAYYGGRFEITRTGAIEEQVHEYDIRSAYPAAMPRLPCLEHGTWRHCSGRDLQKHVGLFVASCTFKAPLLGDGAGQMGALPVRSKEGHLYWPLQGGGVYWSLEIESARALGFEVKLKEGWCYDTSCDCQCFGWVEPLFDYRRSIGSSGPGYPIKLGINSLYGKLAQRKGNGAYNNMVWAGLITAITRSALNDVVGLVPGRIVMIATDGIYSLDPIPSLDVGERLGQWEHEVLDGLFIVQPGLYWCPAKRKRKSRGLSGKFFEEAGRTEGFEHAWSNALGSGTIANDEFPVVDVPVTNFVGLKLAIARNNPQSAGTWVQDIRHISFDYRNKRDGHIVVGGHIVTKIKRGRPGLVSLPHRDFLAAGGHEPWENARAMLEDQPDYVDLGIPFKD